MDDVAELVRLDAESIQVGIDFDVHRCDCTARARRIVEARYERTAVPKRDLQRSIERVVECLGRDWTEHENRHRNSGAAQRQRFVDRVGAQAHCVRLDGFCHRHQSVTVRVALDDERGALPAGEIVKELRVMAERT